MKDTALGEGLVTNIALTPHAIIAIFATQLSPRAVYFIQTGSSALSNTYDSFHVCSWMYIRIRIAKICFYRFYHN